MLGHSLVVLFLLVFAVIIFIPTLIIGSVGAYRLKITRQLQSVQINTTCFVSNVTEETLSFDCNCDGCYPSTCYSEHFAVQYQIENGTKISSIIHMDQIPHLLKIEVNNNYTCYYDRTKVTNVLWIWPSERPDLAMLIAGFSVACVVVLVVILGQIWWFIKQKLSATNPHARF